MPISNAHIKRYSFGCLGRFLHDMAKDITDIYRVNIKISVEGFSHVTLILKGLFSVIDQK